MIKATKWMAVAMMVAGVGLAHADEGSPDPDRPAMKSGSGTPARTEPAQSMPAQKTPAQSMPAQSAPAAVPADTSAAASSALKAEIKIGTALENREATGVADSFPAGTAQLVGWTRITGANEPTTIKHVWKLNGSTVAEIPLDVKSSSYRTHSRKTVGGAGTYTLEVQDSSGNVIGSQDVKVE